MKLYFEGHEDKYALEQSMFTLFPGEKPAYLDALPQEDNSLASFFKEEDGLYKASAILRRHGELFTAKSEKAIPKEPMDKLQKDRLRRFVILEAFYLTAIASLGKAPPWGMLSGVRPVKLPVRSISQGTSFEDARRELEEEFRVSPQRVDLAMDCAKACLNLIEKQKDTDLALYVGIPFCPTRCTYCSFISATANGKKQIPAFLEALLQEIAAAGKAVLSQGLTISSVYIGGGTPTTLDAPELKTLISALKNAFSLSPHIEFTVEAGRPDTITQDKLDVLKQLGCTRISVNPQTMEAHVLEAIGRSHSPEDTLKAYEMVRETGFHAVNMDLIAGLPDDSTEGFQRSLDTVLSLNPENITIHTLALKRGSSLRDKENIYYPTGEEVSAMLDYASHHLKAQGYRPYYLYRQKNMAGAFENIGWCKEGFQSDYNIAMMEEIGSVLSLGAGGITKFVNVETGYITRQNNPKYPKEYIDHIQEIVQNKENFTK